MRFSILLISLILVAGLAGVACGQGATPEIGLPALNQTATPVIEQPTVEVPFQTPTALPTQPIIPGGQTGFFSVNSIPSGADCYFDGRWQGETPLTVEVSTTGNPSHSIKLTLAGYEDWTTTYNGNPGPGVTIPISATLTPSPQVGNIQVSSSPAGATAILDDVQTLITPAFFANVPAGSHSIQVYLSGYQTFYTTVNVQKGQTAYVSATLSPVVTIGSLSITSTPTAATVYVDGNYRGVTPATVGNLQQGSHDVRLTKAGYKDWRNPVSIGAGQTTYLSPKLESDPQPVYGTVSIVSNPSGADIYADGTYVGRTRPGSPLVFTQVKPGSHTLLLTKSGYQDYTSTGTVVAGKNYDLTINLIPVPNPTTGIISVNSAPSDAEVFLNNAFKGLTPMTIDSLAPGTYTVLVRLSGYEDWQSSTGVSPGYTSQVSAVLVPKAAPTTPAPAPTQTSAPSAVLSLVVVAAGAAFSLWSTKK